MPRLPARGAGLRFPSKGFAPVHRGSVADPEGDPCAIKQDLNNIRGSESFRSEDLEIGIVVSHASENLFGCVVFGDVKNYSSGRVGRSRNMSNDFVLLSFQCERLDGTVFLGSFFRGGTY